MPASDTDVVELETEGNKLMLGNGSYSSSVFSFHGTFLSLHDRIRVGPRIPKCPNQPLRCRFIEGKIAISILV